MIEESKPIDEIVGEQAPPPEQAPQPEPVAPSEPDRGDGSWTYAALKDERGKRRALQERTAELEAQVASYTQQPAPTASDQFWSAPEEIIGNLHQRTQQATLRASRAEFIAEHGKAAADAMEAEVTEAMARRDPDLAMVAEAMRASDDPVRVVAHWLETRGRASQGPVYPSNLAGARNVGSRTTKAWSGPTPLDDIFERRR